MSAVPRPILISQEPPEKADSATHAAFLKFLPAVQRHAAISFRGLSATDREEAIAEATAAAFVNVRNAARNGKSQDLTPSTVAKYAVLHVRDGKHVGSNRDRANDVLSPRAQSHRGFRVHGLSWESALGFDCMKDTTAPVWSDRLQEDRRANVADLAAFRLDLSEFLRRQHDRTRRALAMLAAGYRQVEVADKLGVTAPAICQRVKKAEREWLTWQGIDASNGRTRPTERSRETS